MAMDYLPIQASSVPSERVFSSSAETDTKKQNRISPLLMEALQMLKFYLKKKRLDFTESWVTTELQMTVDDPDDDLLGKLLRNVGGQPGRDVFEAIIRSIEADEGPIEG